jgi:cell division protein FtsN
VTITEITDLIAWARRLSATVSSDEPGATSPAEHAAFHAAKADLFTRIDNQHTRHAAETNTGETNTGETNTGETNTGETNTGETNTGRPDPRPNPRRDIR